MSLWKYDKPPVLYPNAVATKFGWTDPVTGEVLVAIRQLAQRAGTSKLLSIAKVSSKLIYKVGDVFSVKVKYTEAVAVTGTPVIAASVNGTPQSLAYASGTGTDVLTFSYTVQAADAAAAGQFTIASPIVLSGGTIKDVDAVADDLSSPNVPLTFSAPTFPTVVIDGVAPVVSTVTGFLSVVTDAIMDAAVKMSEVVAVTGTPWLPITINGVAVNMTYASGSGTDTLHFTHKVVAGDVATAGQLAIGAALLLNSGTIKDVAGNAATLTLNGKQNVSTLTVN